MIVEGSRSSIQYRSWVPSTPCRGMTCCCKSYTMSCGQPSEPSHYTTTFLFMKCRNMPDQRFVGAKLRHIGVDGVFSIISAALSTARDLPVSRNTRSSNKGICNSVVSISWLLTFSAAAELVYTLRSSLVYLTLVKIRNSKSQTAMCL